VFALDLLPVLPGSQQWAVPATCDNLKILKAEAAARSRIAKSASGPETCDALTSTKNSTDAWALVRAHFPDREQALRTQVEQMRRDFATEGAIKDLSRHGRRAKVELIEFEGRLAVRKTFRSMALRYLEREAQVMETLAPVRPEVPKLLARGENYIVIEYVGNGAEPPTKRTNDRPRPLPLHHVRQLADFIKACVGNGIDPMDLRADGNVIYTPSAIYVIDFEFWRQCDPKTPPEKSYCLAGIPPEEQVDGLQAERRARDPYPIGWYPFTLLPVKSFLYDPAWLQRLKRPVHLARLYAGCATGALLRRARGQKRSASSVAAPSTPAST
jgi:predicted Ser/Thr protein kinase